PLTEKLKGIENKLVAFAPASERWTVYAADAPPPIRGIGDCNYLSQAHENAEVAAVEKIVRQLDERASLHLGPGQRDGLREYVLQYAKRSETQQKTAGNSFRFENQISLSPTFSDSYVLKSYLQSKHLPDREER